LPKGNLKFEIVAKKENQKIKKIVEVKREK
jgi:hypothetical protein